MRASRSLLPNECKWRNKTFSESLLNADKTSSLVRTVLFINVILNERIFKKKFLKQLLNLQGKTICDTKIKMGIKGKKIDCAG
jgi:hypothetical protein